MKLWQVLLTTAVLSVTPTATEGGWPHWKFWKSRSTVSTTPTVSDTVSDIALPTSQSTETEAADCFQEENNDLLSFENPFAASSEHWLKRVSGEVCCAVDLLEPQAEQPIYALASCVFLEEDIADGLDIALHTAAPFSCSDSCFDSCSGGQTEGQLVKSEAARLAELIFQLQTACDPLHRRQTVYRMSRQFDSRCYPEVWQALGYALADCSSLVRWQAAREIVIQLRRTGHCPAYTVKQLECALRDNRWPVRRQVAKALRICGYQLWGCAEIGYYRVQPPQTACLDSAGFTVATGDTEDAGSVDFHEYFSEHSLQQSADGKNTGSPTTALPVSEMLRTGVRHGENCMATGMPMMYLMLDMGEPVNPFPQENPLLPPPLLAAQPEQSADPSGSRSSENIANPKNITNPAQPSPGNSKPLRSAKFWPNFSGFQERTEF